MTLEDFFTLTEMKDGLIATSRVEELVMVMQKEKDSVVNPCDAIRQWAAVAGIIAATDNRECLDLFIQLGGLLFIDRWLKDAESFGSNNGDNFVGESIIPLLLAVEKLCIDKEKSISSGIFDTVKHLLDHQNLKVQDKARAIFDSWNDGNSDAMCQQVENGTPVNDGLSVSGDVRREIGELEERSPTSIPSLAEKEDMESCASESMRVDDNLPSQSPNVAVPEIVQDVQIKHDQNHADSLLPSAATSGQDREEASDIIKNVQKLSCTEETTLVETCLPDVPHGSSFGKADTVSVHEIPEDKKLEDKLNSGQENLSGVGVTATIEVANISDADALSSEENAAASSLKVTVDENNLCAEAAIISNDHVCGAAPQVEMAGVPKSVEENDCSPDFAKDSHDKEPVSDKLDELDSSHISKEAGAAAKCKEAVRDRYNRVSNLSALYGGGKIKKRSKKARGKKSTIESEYGILDALHIARQVAKEVEREVIDCKDPLYSSSSERSSGGRIGHSRSADSINDTSSDDSTGQSQSTEDDGRSSMKSGNGDSEAKDPMEDAVESSQMAEAKDKTEKGFDLNEVFSDDGGDKTLFSEEIQDTSSQRLKGLGIDLNMAEDGDETANLPGSSSVNLKESSVEANQARSERLNLDLNSTSDDDCVVISDRNFDLNDRPYSSFITPLSDRGALYGNSSSLGSISLGKPTLDPFVSIMGAKVEVNKDDLVLQRPSYLHYGNGKAILDPSSGGILGLGPTVSSLHPPLMQCSTLPIGPTLSFSPAPYGPIDRTHHVVEPMPHMAPGPTLGLYSPYSVPFPMSLNAGPSRPQLDLNSGFTVDGANQNQGFLMQLFPPSSQAKPMDEHPVSFLQPFPGPMAGAKRKEPEGGWQPSYPVSYGQPQYHPWK